MSSFCKTSSDTDKLQQFYSGIALQTQKQIIEQFQAPRKRVIILAGPTGCGKSALALKLAKEIGGEIVSADSMQIYRGLDIGTAKPTVQERQEVPHYLIDIRDIHETFNVVDFYYEARHACQTILDRGGVPIVVGGAGFYLHALIFGPPSGPPPFPELRKSLEDELEALGVDVMYERLRELDSHYASTVGKRDKQKILRALEIIMTTGKKVSRLSWHERVKPLTFDFHCWFLCRHRSSLYHRIDQRCDQMLEAGFIKEVIRLEDVGLRMNSSACQAIGYRQALEYLSSPRNESDYQQFVKIFKQASRNYGKRQETWFRADRQPLYERLNLDELSDRQALAKIIEDYQRPLS